jgi:hypothetical protein
MSPTLTDTARLEDRAVRLGVSVSRLCRLADVSVRRFWENRADRDELDRVERVVSAHESALVEASR